MYKIYINDRPLSLISTPQLGLLGTPPADHLVARYSGKEKTLLHYVDTLEKGSQLVRAVTIYHADMERLWADFRSHYHLITAAGGLVRNAAAELLFIYRRDSWDLPKGKQDPGETPEQTALREVSEETGLTQLELGDPLGLTYHTYRDRKDRRVLKRTYWYRMQTEQTALVPQVSEDIEVAEWVSAERAASLEPIYGNVREVFLRGE